MRIALGLEYHGGAFCGWQTQPSGCAVQDVLERALAAIAGEKISTICAGRTDAGVHALEQVVHFDTSVERPDSAWVRGVNALLPVGAAVIWSRPAAEFHARYAALERCYRYVLLNHPQRPALNHGRVGWSHLPLDIDTMRISAKHLLGKHDFSAFRSSECQAKSPVRALRSWVLEQRGAHLRFELTANGFLHHMVRNIVGSLLYVGCGRKPTHWLKEVLESRDRGAAAPTFEASGLYLAQITYEERWSLPGFPRIMPFLYPGPV